MKINILWLIAITAIAFAQPALADNGFILKEGKEYPVCRKLVKVVNLPENVDTINNRVKIKDIIFPKSSSNFKSIRWQPITLAEAKKLTPDNYLDKVMAADKDYAINVARDWDGKSDFIFEKTEIDYDNIPPSETIIRYRLPSLGSWNCLFSINTPNPMRDDFNPSENRGSYLRPGEGCSIFNYNGQVYLTHVLASEKYGFMYVFKPESIGQDIDGTIWNVNKRQICRIDKTKH